MKPISPTPSPDIGRLSIEQLAANPNVSDRDKIGEVSRQFESYLLRQYLGEARKPITHSKFNPEGETNHVYQDMITSNLADSLSKAGSFGLGNALKEQLIRQNLATADETTPAASRKTKS